MLMIDNVSFLEWKEKLRTCW